MLKIFICPYILISEVGNYAIVMHGETKLAVSKAKIKNPIVFFLVRSQATCMCKIKL